MTPHFAGGNSTVMGALASSERGSVESPPRLIRALMEDTAFEPDYHDAPWCHRAE